MPSHVIARGRAGPGLLAHIVVAKFDGHLPLYRQAEIFARQGVTLETSTLSGWVGATAAALMPLVDLVRRDVIGGSSTARGRDRRKNCLFAGSDCGADRAAALYSLIETANLNALNPEAYLRDLLGSIADQPAS